MENLVRAYILVSGVVQMVGFRFFTVRKAKDYGLSGYVRNTLDGKVEVEVEGEEGLIKDFIKELNIGPSASRVTAVKVEWFPYIGEFNTFSVRY